MEERKGTFMKSLTQSFKNIRESKAASITEDVELAYSREIEDLCRKVRQCDRDREDILINLAPGNITSTSVVPSDFDADEFLKRDIQIGINKRDALIKLSIAVHRYEDLFGPYRDITKVKEHIPEFQSKFKEE